MGVEKPGSGALVLDAHLPNCPILPLPSLVLAFLLLFSIRRLLLQGSRTTAVSEFIPNCHRPPVSAGCHAEVPHAFCLVADPLKEGATTSLRASCRWTDRKRIISTPDQACLRSALISKPDFYGLVVTMTAASSIASQQENLVGCEVEVVTGFRCLSSHIPCTHSHARNDPASEIPWGLCQTKLRPRNSQQ